MTEKNFDDEASSAPPDGPSDPPSVITTPAELPSDSMAEEGEQAEEIGSGIEPQMPPSEREPEVETMARDEVDPTMQGYLEPEGEKASGGDNDPDGE